MQTDGLIDLQVNGFAGVDFNSGKLTAAELDHALQAMLACGVTSLLPTLITATPDALQLRITALDRAIRSSQLGPLMCPGIHLEGPFLNSGPGFHGCHPAEAMRAPDLALFDQIQAQSQTPILLVTLAPELAGSQAFIAEMTRRQILTSIGHSDCNFSVVDASATAGLQLSTHLGNGLPQHLPKLDNPIFAQLAEDRLTGCFIADGFHVPPAALKAMLRAKTIEHCILVSDAVSAAAAPAGLYDFADMRIERLANGMVMNPNGAGLAGSTLCLDQAVRNVVQWGLVDFDDAIRMASGNVRALLAPALAARQLHLPSGHIEWDAGLYIRKTVIANQNWSF